MWKRINVILKIRLLKHAKRCQLYTKSEHARNKIASFLLAPVYSKVGARGPEMGAPLTGRLGPCQTPVVESSWAISEQALSWVR